MQADDFTQVQSFTMVGKVLSGDFSDDGLRLAVGN